MAALHHEHHALPLSAAALGTPRRRACRGRDARNNTEQFQRICLDGWIRLTRSDVWRPLSHRYAERTISSVVSCLARFRGARRLQ